MLREGFKTYTTTDLTQAAFLVARGIELLTSRRQQRRTFFIFRSDQTTEEVVSQYFANGSVHIGDFRRAWHDLKNVIFSPNNSWEGKTEQ